MSVLKEVERIPGLAKYCRKGVVKEPDTKRGCFGSMQLERGVNHK